MKYIKNEFRASLVNSTLNPCMAVALECRSVAEFPFKDLLETVSSKD